MSRTAAIIGGGVIGGGWTARFLLNGWNVRLYDPDPEAERTILEVLENARRSLPGLHDVALPQEGELCICNSIDEAVKEAALKRGEAFGSNLVNRGRKNNQDLNPGYLRILDWGIMLQSRMRL